MISLGHLLHSQSPLQGGNGRSFNAEADKGIGTGPGNSGHIVTGRPAFSAHASSIQQFTVQDVQIAQKKVEYELKTKMDAQIALVKPEAAELLAPTASGTSFASDDFSPEAVTDRIVGFIESRIEAERANGASEEELQSMFGQAMKGLEQGLKEAKEVISAMDMFGGEVKDTFFETVSLLDERMAGLEKTLFGAESPDAQVVAGVPGNENVSVSNNTSASERGLVKALDVERAFSSIAKGNERYAAQSNALFFSQDNQFDMEVVTQDGDKVTIHVGAGESLDFRSGSQVTPRGSVSGFALEQSNYYDISFSVDGDLDEGELAALNDLFSQVNDIADSFYSGNVGEAFEQAVAVGYDAEELAAFAVNMTHSEVVAVAQTYREVAAADQGESVESSSNPLQSIMDRLSEFAAQVLTLHDVLLDNPNRPSNQQALFKDILSELVPVDDVEPQGVRDANAGSRGDDPVGLQIHDAFKGFIDSILG
ncbi:MAG: DUF5610 domain-containing protein [Pseudomonadales bacterium]|nr:DUF5610 domain-containing protein [Pseudomonadales bacterium]